MDRRDWLEFLRAIPGGVFLLFALWMFCLLLFALVPGPGA